MSLSGARIAGLLLLFAGLLTASCVQAAAGPEAPGEPAVAQAALVRVHLPLKGNADQVLEAMIGRVRDRLLEASSRTKDTRRPLLVLQLDPHQRSAHDMAGGAGSQFERALSLARFLCSRDMAGVKTIAFVPHSIRGHSTLLALACEEIVMAPAATLGEAGVDEPHEGTISQTVIGAYREIAAARRTMPVALALGMIDASTEILQLETEQGTEFVLRSEFDASKQQREVLDEQILVPAGTLASYEGREGRQFGFVKFLATNREGLARALNVPTEAIREEDTLAGEWRPTIIDLRGPITPRMANRLETMLTTAVEQGVNWVGLRIDSAGGDLAASVQIATTVAKLDANTVRTVAYVPAEATGGAALVALSCDQLVMHPGARLGAKAAKREVPANIENDLRVDARRLEEDRNAELVAAKTSIRESLAPLAERDWQLLEAMIDPEIELARYRNKKTGEMRWMSGHQAVAQQDVVDWEQVEPLLVAQATATIDGTRAEQLGLAKQTVESYEELKQLYRLQEDPPVAKPNWALELIEALASPELAWLLLLVGFYGLYIEMRAPGIGFGAFVGSVSILLFFWSQYLNGTAGWLEVLLFVAGICFLLMEIFVLPGFGIFGLGGGAMVLASLILASLTFVRPQSEQDMEELTRSVGTVAIAAIGMIISVLVSRRYLPEAPLFRHIILARPEPGEREVLANREMLADYGQLVGLQGIATTHLRPTGKAEIDHQLLDVIAEAEPLDRGTPIEVVEAHANRVVVRATGPA